MSNPDSGVPGIALEPSSLGGFNVIRAGKRLGWIHGDDDDAWRAFVPARDTGQGRRLGETKSKADAVRLIVAASPP